MMLDIQRRTVIQATHLSGLMSLTVHSLTPRIGTMKLVPVVGEIKSLSITAVEQRMLKLLRVI